MDNFTVGDRCLVHRLESEAGQPLNGQHVTLADAIIEKGRFKCKFDDGSFACIKPCNLQIINGDDSNQTTETCEENASSNLNQKEDQTKMEVTTDDDKKETAATSTTTTQPQNEKEEPPPPTHHQQQQKEEEREECSICLDVLPKDPSKFMRAACCGKGLHNKCRADMCSSKMSKEQKNRCVMCRAQYPSDETKEGNKETIKRLRKWAKKGKAWAQDLLGQQYRDGTRGVRKDEKRAFVLFNLASEQGDAGAQYNLGVMYERGQDVDKDEKRAVELYKLAADQGVADAQFNLGCMYYNGQGVDESYSKAKEWFTKAAAQGYEDAINALKQVNKDLIRTTATSSTINPNTTFCSYCNKPAPPNRCQQCRSVSYCNRECQMKHWTAKPNGHKKQCKKFKALLKLKKEEDQMKKKVTTNDNDKKETAAAPPTKTQQQQQEEKEGEECSICLDLLSKDTNKYVRATCCGKGMHNKCRDDMFSSKMSKEQKGRCVMCRTKYPLNTKEGKKESVQRLRKWVKKGKAWAQAMLGQSYRDGDGIKKDEKRAVVLFNLASEQGDAGAQYNLGCMYNNGRGVDKDDEHAVELFTLAAEQGHADAQYNLGNMYEHGKGVDKDDNRAAKFYTSAADQEYTNAQYNLGVMYRDGQGVDKDEKRAVELFTLASEHGDADAQCNLGCMYANGQGVDRSLTKAREWWTNAAAQGDEDAIKYLKQVNIDLKRTTTPSSTVNSNTIFCSYCNKPAPPNRCQQCRSVSYCNRECQMKHWKTKPNGHKKQCKKLAAAFKLNKKREK